MLTSDMRGWAGVGVEGVDICHNGFSVVHMSCMGLEMSLSQFDIYNRLRHELSVWKH